MNIPGVEELFSIVQKAAAAVLEVYERDFEVTTKSDNTPVTEADMLSDKILHEELEKFGWPILSEETADDISRLASDYVWIIDPIDGTQDFVYKIGTFTIVLGLAYKGEPILGLVYEPVHKKLYFAEKGKGAFVQIDGEEPQKMEPSVVGDMSQARMVMSGNNYQGDMKVLADELSVSEIIKSGGTARKIIFIASNQADIWFSNAATMGQWDTCAAHCIAEEAGAIVTDMHGNKITYNGEKPTDSYGYVVSNKMLHQQVIGAIKKLELDRVFR